jgi:phospholipase/carboxylesterase
MGTHGGDTRSEHHIEVPFTSRASCLLLGPEAPPSSSGGKPPLLVALHGQDQSGARQRRWLQKALPPNFAAAFPDGFHKHEVRKPERPMRLGYAWYMFTGDQEAFNRSLQESEVGLWSLVDRALDSLDADPARVYLCGFSQGAYLTHCAAVRAPQRVAGWVAQSGRLKTEFLADDLPGVKGKPVLIQHGRNDPHLPAGAADNSASALTEHGAEVTLLKYDSGHEITAPMVDDLRAWLIEREPA